MSNDFKDILDLCKLNQMEESAKKLNDADPEVETHKKAIEWKKRQLSKKIIYSQEPALKEVMEKQRKWEEESKALAEAEGTSP